MWDAQVNPRIKTYPAPEVIPADRICRVLSIPNDMRIIAAVSDVLAYLTHECVWEASDSVSDFDMRALMGEMVHNYFEGECEVTVTTIPPGTIMAFAGTAPPSGWLLCDNTQYAKEEYPDLYDVIDDTFKNITHFRVPDLRGRTVVGTGTGQSLTTRSIGQQFGAETHTLTTNQIPAHSHPPANGTNFVTNTAPTPSTWHFLTSGGAAVQNANGGANTGNAGGGQAHNNMQPSLALNYIIKT